MELFCFPDIHTVVPSVRNAFLYCFMYLENILFSLNVVIWKIPNLKKVVNIKFKLKQILYECLPDAAILHHCLSISNVCFPACVISLSVITEEKCVMKEGN